MHPASLRTPIRASAVVLLLAALTAAAPASAQVGLQQPRGPRPPDGLLDRPDLQRLVDAQTARDGRVLVAALDDADPVVRARAAFALGSVQDTAAVLALVEALGDPDARVRADAAFALGQTADSTSEAALLAAVDRETDPAARAELLDALGKTGGSVSLAALAGRTAEGDERAVLALALGRYGLRGIHDSQATRRLAGFVTDADPLVGADAAWYFARADTTAWTFAVPDLRRALDGLDPRSDGDAETAIHLLAALGRLDDREDTGRFLQWLDDAADWRVRVNAARALAGLTRDSIVMAELMQALDDPRLHVAVEAARALSADDSLDSGVETEIGKRVMTRPRPWQVSVALLPAIAKAGHSRLVLLWLLWLDGNPPRDVTAYSAGLRALGWGDGREAYLVLQHAATRPVPQISAAALEALAQWWSRGVRTEELTPERYFAVFERALRSRDVAAVATVAPVLADSLLRPLGSVTLLEDVYGSLAAPADLEAMVAVLEALGKAGDRAAQPLLEGALQSATPAVRREAASALEELTGEAVAASAGAAELIRPVDWEFLRDRGARPVLRLDTTRGAIELELDVESAPQTVETVLRLAEDGRYDGVEFHRVVPNFVIQGGDVGRGDGWGGPGFAIHSELTRISFDRGTVGMASAGKDTEGSQYFVTHSMQPHLDGRYTAFGRVVNGMDVVDAILVGDKVVRAVAP
ncbi:MAG TPA: peptidylprolyl isomerase [Gemmatimonadota bacterium]|nr:peptidylprolyl isomerase [Gemmatimonadota bacterium]